MKNRLITLLTMGHTLDRAKDRTGAYTLRHVNKFPKFRPVARGAAKAPLPASHAAPSAQPLLFAAAKAPAAALPQDRSDRAYPPPAPKPRFLWFAKLGAFLAAAVAFVPKTAARIRGGLRPPPANSRPHAQAELALEKVTVIRNDLSDADLVVVAVQPKPEDSRAAQAEARAPAGNPWTRVTARWIKLKRPAELAQMPP